MADMAIQEVEPPLTGERGHTLTRRDMQRHSTQHDRHADDRSAIPSEQFLLD